MLEKIPEQKTLNAFFSKSISFFFKTGTTTHSILMSLFAFDVFLGLTGAETPELKSIHIRRERRKTVEKSGNFRIKNYLLLPF